MEAFDYQEKGARWLAQRTRAYLTDVTGLGKTIQAILGACYANAQNIVVIAPASMVGTWRAEVALWGDWMRTFRVYSYDKYVRSEDVRNEVREYAPDLLILDEGHYLKGITTKRTKYILSDLSKRVKRVWMLSATPCPNGPHELWTAFKYLRPDLLTARGVTTYRDFLNEFCDWTMGEYGPRIFGLKREKAQDLKTLMFGPEGFFMRRTYESAEVRLDLPKLDLRLLPLSGGWSAELAAALEALDDGGLEYGELPEQSEHIATARRVLGEHKAKLVLPMLLDELKNDPHHNVLVFAYHRSVLDYLERHFKAQGVGTLRIDGSVPSGKRTRMVRDFQEGNARVFLLQITAGGVGITLTRAKDVVIVEPSWVPGENVQAIGRVRRIGQKADTVSARMATLHGTLDDALNAVLLRKTRAIASTLDG
jgi:SWI/SNF-related matrix-associated actin-dependent regulator 1 of chromatin subfamily A